MFMQRVPTFEQRLEAANDYAPAWRFDQDGAVVIGEVIGFSEFDGGYGPYPIVTLRLDDGSERAVHCQREVLSQELALQRPKIGETLGIKYLGQPEGKRYHRYTVMVERPEGASFDWSRYAAPGGERSDARVSSPPAEANHDADIPF
jgi:hypothetical protein